MAVRAGAAAIGVRLHGTLSIGTLAIGTLAARALSAADPVIRGTAGIFRPGPVTRGARRIIAVNLKPGNTQPGNAVPFDCALPGGKFLGRKIIASADLGQLDGPAMDGLDNDRL